MDEDNVPIHWYELKRVGGGCEGWLQVYWRGVEWGSRCWEWWCDSSVKVHLVDREVLAGKRCTCSGGGRDCGYVVREIGCCVLMMSYNAHHACKRAVVYGSQRSMYQEGEVSWV